MGRKRVGALFDYHGRSLTVAELQPGWRVAYGDHVAVDRHLDRALARALGVPPGSTLELARRILNAPSTDVLQG